ALGREMRTHQSQQALGRSIEILAAFVDAFADLAGDTLAQLDAPLVKGIDVPDDSLNKYLVFIERYQGAQVARRQFIEQQYAGGAVAWAAVGVEISSLEAAFHEGIGLGQHIGEQGEVMLFDAWLWLE